MFFLLIVILEFESHGPIYSTLRDPFIEKFWISKILIRGCILYHLIPFVYTLIGYLTCCFVSGSRLET